jgi:hypothetical protein
MLKRRRCPSGSPTFISRTPPWEVDRRLANLSAVRLEFFIERIHIVYPDAHPCPRTALTVFAKEVLDTVAAHTAKGWWLLPAPATGEAQLLHVIGDACLHVVNGENGVDAFQLWHGDGISSMLVIMAVGGIDISCQWCVEVCNAPPSDVVFQFKAR